MGCTNCASKGGCSTRKGEERELLAQLLPELYPGRRWGDVDDERRDGVTEREGRKLARQAAEFLKAPTYFRPGEPQDLCDFIYVLCVGRQPGLIESWDAHRITLDEGEQVREKYLRVAMSSIARVATVQEVTLELAREAPAEEWRLSLSPSPGIYDPILLKRTRKLVELLVANELTFLDFGLIENPPLGFDDAGYTDEYGQSPGIVNYLFYSQPPRAVSTQYLPGSP